jgi:hypothetical protein
MKKLLENWNNFVNEESNDEEEQIIDQYNDTQNQSFRLPDFIKAGHIFLKTKKPVIIGL